MDYKCFSCHKSLDSLPKKVGFREECHYCSADVHVCKNCDFYDESHSQECRESSAERVRDKEKLNYCEYFTMHKASEVSKIQDEKDLLAAAEALFKK